MGVRGSAAGPSRVGVLRRWWGSLAAGILRHRLPLGVFSLALSLRLLFLFAGPGGPENCGWYWDSYHHWQIAYFTWRVGVHRGPRLWDLGGMEYFWGVLPPLVEAGLMALFRTASIVPYRVANCLFGSASVLVLCSLVGAYFSRGAGLAAALICAVNPVLVVADASGMEEPLAILLLLLGVWHYGRGEFRAGILLALASMCRAEYWLLSMGLLGLYLVVERSSTRFVPALSGWLLAMAPYLWHLWVYAEGNPIYPIYHNFYGSAVGRWLARVSLTPHQALVRYAFVAVFLASAASLLLLARRRPRAYPVYALFLGYTLFISFMLGFTAYTACYVDRFLVDRIFSLDHMFIALLVSAAIFGHSKSRAPRLSALHLDKAALALILLAFLALWTPVARYYTDYGRALEGSEALAEFVADSYQGGTVLVPGSEPAFTYYLVQRGVTATQILSGKYHPADPEECMGWLKAHGVTLAVVPEADEFYLGLVERFGANFTRLRGDGLQVYRVTLA